MSSNIVLSVVIPAYNEEERVGKTLRAVDSYLRKEPYNYEIIVVDDGSSDATEALVRAHAPLVNNLKLLPHRHNVGKGWAVRTGMLSAIGRYRLFMDADGSTDIRHWPAMQDALESGADVVVGSRHVDGSNIEVHQSPHRVLLGRVFRGLVRAASGLPIRDTQNGFKAFTADAAERVFRRQRLFGWAFDVEVLSIARKLGYGMVEVPIKWIDDNRSRMTFSAMPRMLADLFKIRLERIETPSYSLPEMPRLVTLS